MTRSVDTRVEEREEGAHFRDLLRTSREYLQILASLKTAPNTVIFPRKESLIYKGAEARRDLIGGANIVINSLRLLSEGNPKYEAVCRRLIDQLTASIDEFVAIFPDSIVEKSGHEAVVEGTREEVRATSSASE